MSKPGKVLWCDNGWLPYCYGFCPNEKAWDREMKRMSVTNEPYPGTCAHTTKFGVKKGRTACCIITLSDEVDEWPLSRTIGIIVHECVHVWRFACNHIGEDMPSSEFEAYAVQRMTESILKAYFDSRRPKFRTKG